MSANWLFGAKFGSATAPAARPLPASEDVDPDDERLPETPPDVVKMLGFDPAKIKGFDAAE